MQTLLGGWQVAPIVTVDFRDARDAHHRHRRVTYRRQCRSPQPVRRSLRTRTGAANPGSIQASFQRMRPAPTATPSRISLVGPTYADLDAAISRFFPLPETMQLEFRGECFNCFNHPNLLGPTAALQQLALWTDHHRRSAAHSATQSEGGFLTRIRVPHPCDFFLSQGWEPRTHRAASLTDSRSHSQE